MSNMTLNSYDCNIVTFRSSGLSKSGRDANHRHRSVVEGVHLVRAEYQSNHIRKDELGTVQGLHECPTCCQGIGNCDQRSQPKSTSHSANTNQGRSEAGDFIAERTGWLTSLSDD